MTKAIDFETRDYAEGLFITGGKTLEEISEITGVSSRQLKTWSSADGWVTRRDEYRNSLAGTKEKITMLKQKMLDKAISSLDPQDVYAVSRLEAATRIKHPPVANIPIENAQEIKTPQDAVAALIQVIELKTNQVLGNPESLDFKVIKDLKQSIELLEQMRSKYGGDDQEKKGIKKHLDPETLKAIREEIYGLV